MGPSSEPSRTDSNYRQASTENIELSTPLPQRSSLDQESNNISKPLINHDFKPVRLLSASWKIEFLSWLLAVVFFGALIGVLIAFDGQSVPHWRFGITLGALASAFATLTGYMLMSPLNAAFGQLKWMWFERTRPLLDFETFESANQGPKGSVLLLFKRKGGVTASIGAILIILQLAIGPFVQQIIQTKEHQINITNALIPISINYTMNTEAEVDIDLSMKAAIMNAALDINANSSNFDVPTFCPTGNCTWLSYESLGFCSTCKNLTSQLKPEALQSVEGTNWTLPNGLFLVVEDFRAKEALLTITMNSTYMNPQLDSLIVSQNQSLNSALDVFVILGNTYYGQNEIGPSAAECLLQLCVQSYDDQENETIFQETVSNSRIITSHDPGSGLPFTSGNFSYDQAAQRNLQAWLGPTFNDKYVEYDSITIGLVFPDPILGAMFYALNDSTPNKIDVVFSNIAKSMTRNLRSPPSATSPNAISVNSQVFGQTSYLTTVISIQWYWIALPAFLVVAVLVFMIAVILQAERKNFPYLKNSSLATLFYGLGSDVMRDYRGVGRKMEIQNTSKELRVRFRDDTNGRGLEKV